MKFSFYSSFLIVLIAIVFSVSTNAQNFKVSFSDNTKMKYDFDDAVSLSNGQYIILKLKEKRSWGKVEYETILVLVSPDMEEITEKELPIEEKNSSLGGF